MTERTKRCTGPCQTVKPWSDYSPRTYWDDGGVRTIQSRCKPCASALTCEQRKRDAASHKPRHATYMREWRSRREAPEMTPEQAAVVRDQKRESYRRRFNVTPERYKPRRRPRDTPRIRVPAAPFRDWLLTFGTSAAAIARRTDMNDRRVSSILRGEQTRVELDTVDRALLAVGDGTTLGDLYEREELAA